MKKIITLLSLVCVMNFYGQQKVAGIVRERIALNASFKEFSPLQATGSIAPKSNVVNEATYATLDIPQVKDIARSKYENIRLILPYNNTQISVLLYRVELLAEGFHVDTDKQVGVSFERGAHYRGIIEGDNASIASFNFFKGEMNGIVSGAPYNNIVVGKLQRDNNTSDYIIYSDGKLNITNDFTCRASEPANEENSHKGTLDTDDVNSARCVTAYFEMDHQLFLENGSDVVQTNNWMVSVFNNVQTLFANEGITTALKSVFIWTTPDPYFGESSFDYLFQFFQQRPAFDGDIGQLVGIDEGGLGGVAIDVAGLCSDNNVSYSDINIDFNEVPMFSWTVQVITHELGHLLGSPHTHGCHWNGNNTAIDGCGSTAGFEEGNCEIGPVPEPPAQGTIMSYCHLIPNVGVSLANGFGPQPAARILQHVNSSICLSIDCINTCINTVAVITTTATTPDSAAISWTDETSDGPWEVAVAEIGDNFTNWQLTTDNTFTFTGLDSNSYYKFGVRPICTDTAVVSATSELIFATAGDYCSGLSFTDTGGLSGNYSNNQYVVRTITPNVPGAEAVVTFTEFDTEFDFDFMFVYNGATTEAPLLGVFSGNDLPGPFTSTAPDGSLTFEFISDQFLTEGGWEATVSCVNLSTADNALTAFAYYPNPSTGIVNITAGEEMNRVEVFNVAGQLLLNKELNSREGAIDISAFARGIYIFRVSSGTTEMNFRIIKQ